MSAWSDSRAPAVHEPAIAPPASIESRYGAATLLTVCVATFVLLLDITVVNVALPTIRADLHGSFLELQWVIDAYTVALAAGLLTAGALADRYGRRRLFVVGMYIFALGSLGCGVAPSALLLDLFRAVQGGGAAIVFATALALIGAEFHGAARPRAFGAFGATIGASVAIGPLAGGVITEGLGWRWIFLLSLPISAAVIVFAKRGLAESRNPEAHRLDVFGLVTFTAALGCLVTALLRGNVDHWSSALIVGLLLGAAALAIAFIAIEVLRPEPMLDLRMLRSGPLAGASLAAFGVGATILAMFLYLTLYLQNALGASAIQTGLYYLPITLVSFFAAGASVQLMLRVPIANVVSVGVALVGVGLLLMLLMGDGSSWTILVPGFVVSGVGLGLANASTATAAMDAVDTKRSGVAAGINDTFRQVGVAVGIAAFGALVQAEAAHTLTKDLGPLREGVSTNAIASALVAGAPLPLDAAPHDVAVAVGEMSRHAFVDGLHTALLVAGLVALGLAVASMLLLRSAGRAGSTVEPVDTSVPLVAKKNYLAWAVQASNYRSDWSGREKLRFFARYALLAPSAHNTQPWRFELQEESMTIRPDSARALTFSGPSIHEPWLSLGACIETFRLAAVGFGCAVEVEYREAAGEVAMSLLENDGRDPEPRLIDAIGGRASNRNPFETTELPGEIVARLADAEGLSVAVKALTSRQDIERIAQETHRATKAVMSDPKFRAELSLWVRTNITGAYDGMPGFTQGMPTPPSLIAKRLIRRVDISSGQAKQDARRVRESSALIILSAASEGIREALDVGRMYARVGIVARLNGLESSGIGAVTAHPASRRTIEDVFSLQGTPMVMLRVGRATTPARHTPRWPLDAVSTGA
jgi:EmrB/QacA subfamily drug resistance transporter